MSTPNLKEFLQKNGVFEKFCENLKRNPNPHISDFDEFIKDQKIDGNKSDGGLFAFVWAETPKDEGFHFWNEIDSRWQKYYYRTINDGKL